MKNPSLFPKILVLSFTIAVLSGSAQQSENNLGAACGCPLVSARPNVNVSDLPGFNAGSGELTTGATLTCLNNYILDRKIYVPSGQTINIAPGTVIKGKYEPNHIYTTALVIERGGKINAIGSADCPIVFTAEADLLNGAYPISNRGYWGGLVILGKAQNNVTFNPNLSSDSGVRALTFGLGAIENFSDDSKIYFGANLAVGEAFDNADNSGILKYVSIRFAGAFIQSGRELNALTLGSVGSGTTIDHVEIISGNDDGIEFFGGTVNVKYAAVLFGNDDMFDWDLGYCGKIQFAFGLKTDLTASQASDNGFEGDSDDLNSSYNPKSHPIIFNATLIGNAKVEPVSDNSSIAAINAKELTEGEISNSVFANFKNGLNLVQVVGSRNGSEAYHNWSALHGNGSQSLKIKCNTFVGVTNNLTIDNAPATLGDDLSQFTGADLNVTTPSLPGFNYALTINNTTNQIFTSPDATPNPALSTAGCPVAPVDGFFVPVSYRGAFSPINGPNWLTQWSYTAAVKALQGSQFCPTDINRDGSTTAADLNLLVPQYGLKCK